MYSHIHVHVFEPKCIHVVSILVTVVYVYVIYGSVFAKCFD